MRRWLRQHIPSMFHRRLLLLLAAAGVVTGLLGVQAARLTLGASHRRSVERVEDALTETTFIPTVRGKIRDRWGRVLAQDEPGYDVAVDYQVISGQWSYDQAVDAARQAHDDRWGELSQARRRALIDRQEQKFDQQVENMWRTLADLGGIDRAEIERRQSRIVSHVQRVASHLWSTWRRQRAERLGEPVPLSHAIQPISEQRQAHPILRDVSEQARLVVQNFSAEANNDPALRVWQHVTVRRPKRRRYPLETMTLEMDRTHLPGPLREDTPREVTVRGIGLHLIGLMRDVWKEDIQGEDGRPFDPIQDLGGYRPGDRVGRFGVEAARESRLRGRRGKIIHQLDTGRQRRIEPVPGKDVRLTIDIQLQARVQTLLKPEFGLMKRRPWHGLDDPKQAGQPLRGAAVVLDAQTSEVLAAVSMPSMPLKTLRDEPEKIYDDKFDKPYVNRTVARPYQPGSTIKPILLTSAATAGAHTLGEPIVCRGYLNEDDPNHYRCWIFKRYMSVHGPLKGAEAIARSCNVYFYTLGRAMGVRRLAKWYGRFGLGAPTQCGLPEEVGGDLPDPERAGDYITADAIFMGIGQGPVRWTPMQAAGAYATLLRGGVVKSPTVIKDAHRESPRQPHRINVDQQAVDTSLQGLHDVVNATYGTGRGVSLGDDRRELLFDVEDVTIYGKSGTAQGVPQRIDSDDDGRITQKDKIVKQGDHAWFVALPQPEDADQPTHVVVVVVEYAGSGSQVAGPVANQIVHALQAEGYL